MFGPDLIIRIRIWCDFYSKGYTLPYIDMPKSLQTVHYRKQYFLNQMGEILSHGTWNESWAFMACAKLRPGWILIFYARSKHTCMRFGLWAHYPFVKCIPGPLAISSPPRDIIVYGLWGQTIKKFGAFGTLTIHGPRSGRPMNSIRISRSTTAQLHLYIFIYIFWVNM